MSFQEAYITTRDILPRRYPKQALPLLTAQARLDEVGIDQGRGGAKSSGRRFVRLGLLQLPPKVLFQDATMYWEQRTLAAFGTAHALAVRLKTACSRTY